MADDIKVTEEVSPEVKAEVPAGNEQITLAPEHADVSAEVAPVVPVTKTDDKDTTLDEFEVAKGDAVKEPEVKVTDKKVEAPKVEVKPAVVPVATAKPAARDYSGLPDDVVPLFKRMGNEAFDAFKPVYLKKVELENEVKTLKEAQGKIPETYYEHPLGYALTPEYEQAATAASESKVIFDHWAQQLSAVNEGAAIYKTLARDPKTGQIVYGNEMPVGKATATALLAHFNNTQTTAAQAEAQLNNIQQTFGAKYTEQKAQLKGMEDSIFKQFADPKHPAQDRIKSTIQELPAAYRNNALAPMVAKSLVLIDVLVKALNDAKAASTAQATAATKVAETVKAAGPTATGAATAPQKGGDVSFDDFEKAKE